MAERHIAGTNEIWRGMVVKLGEFEYTTVGGGIEGDRQQLSPIENQLEETDNTNEPVIFEYFEDYDIGTNDGVLNTVDVVYWNNQGRNDIAQFVSQFILSGNFPPNRPTQGGQGGMSNQQNNQQNNIGPGTGNGDGDGETGGGGGMY